MDGIRAINKKKIAKRSMKRVYINGTFNIKVNLKILRILARDVKVQAYLWKNKYLD
ncbi:hypothetical protein [Clostridium cellulovorans]|uniref:hypothetical protein n=1 Tax=Clostridium cellulovorans TaxID=1493 RepID=UPI0002E00D1F|nr:hypothetical protein [Clostridium cellulovorans]